MHVIRWVRLALSVAAARSVRAVPLLALAFVGMEDGFDACCGHGRLIQLRAIRCLPGIGRGAADAAGVGDHDAQHPIRTAFLAEQQRYVAAAGAAIGEKSHKTPSLRA